MLKSFVKILLVSIGLTIISNFNFAKAQEHSGCFMLDSQGNYIDLSYSVCGVSDNNNDDLPLISEPIQEENLFVVTNTNIENRRINNSTLVNNHVISISIKNQTGLAFQKAKLNYNLVKLYKNNNGLVYKKEPLYTGAISHDLVITPDQEVVFRDEIDQRIPGFSDMVVEVINIELIDEYGEKLYHQF